ncbi:hypothetical protein SPRG_09198 [Saprolegnia parasitica CBS 223.65]|uniref:Major facilitator superfamily (MFS) profile domain-containing protein n=1 Tax=Saprolegnia parasitica (strain CBS 223.65) TaxID=695850 RepID=A0A067C7B6_SAPPC|nr:hypothetical protein SPRG_09198 [Saprolegnia parasitica CBS 223.65]KDO25060.1 hypothetical protein SPRG_09198 [Saprolegnia parasitica CBS 223.65]|eukprot:XP_012204135.1 hypothetical protein SPRG_09198 [Saprolegnia parasitica CBS 223.65]
MYWRITVPAKTKAEVEAEPWLVALPGLFVWRGVGFRRWHALAATFCTQMCCGSIYAYPALLNSLNVHFGETDDGAAMTRIMLVAMACLGVAGALSGPALERRAPRVGMFAGSLCACLGLLVAHIAILVASEALLILGYGVLFGAGVGLLVLSSIATAQKWYPDYRATCMGVSVLGFGAGLTLWNRLYMSLLHLATTTDVVTTSAPLAHVFSTSLTIIGPVLVLSSVVLRSPPSNYVVHGVDMHCVAVDSHAAHHVVQDEFFKVGMTLVNFDAIRASNDAFVGTDGHYYQQVKALSLPQCILSTDFALLYLAFAATVAPSILFVSQLVPMTSSHFTQHDDVAAMAFARVPALVSLLGRLLAPLLSDGVVRVFYANPAFARKVTLLVLLGTECAMLPLIAHAISSADYATFQIAVTVMTFATGGGFAVVPCLLSDLYGVFNMGTMYGLLLTSWCGGVIAVGLVLTNTDVADASALTGVLYALCYVLFAAWMLLWLVRTSSTDRFFPGYQITACGCVLVQIPFRRNVSDTLRDDVSSSSSSIVAHQPGGKSPARSSFFLWDDHAVVDVGSGEASTITEEDAQH